MSKKGLIKTMLYILSVVFSGLLICLVACDTEHENIDENVDVYTLTINCINGQENIVITQPYGSKIDVQEPQKEGYSFVGWSEEIPLTMPAEDLYIYAKWQKNKYTLTIEYGVGQDSLLITQEYGTKIEIDEPQREGNHFMGWDKVIPTTMPAENITITAKWKAIFKTSTVGVAGLTDYGKTFTEIVIPKKIYGTIRAVNVTSIVDNAFSGCSSLTSITIPDSVTSIGDNAFSGCSSLTSITIPDSVTSIGAYAFSGCSSLTSITIPDSVTSIRAYAFSGCSSLTSITIPDSVTSIGYNAFYDCDSLTSIVISDSVTSIGIEAFSLCESLNSVNYLGTIDSWVQIEFRSTSPFLDRNSANPLAYTSNFYINGVLVTEATLTTATKISNYAFYNFNSLTSIVISDSVTSIGAYAFYGCDSLTSIVISDSVTSIGDSAFEYCASLTSIEIPDNVTSIGDSAFAVCRSLTSIEIPGSVTSIRAYAFSGCSSLTSITIPDSVTSIGYGVFQGCRKLTSIIIPDSVITIEALAFNGCGSLRSIDIGNKVSKIGTCAFHGCNLLEVKFNGTSQKWRNITSYRAELFCVHKHEETVLIVYCVDEQIVSCYYKH